jgi:hypothetical protein
VVIRGSIIVHNLSSAKKGGHFQNIMPARRADGWASGRTF